MKRNEKKRGRFCAFLFALFGRPERLRIEWHARHARASEGIHHLDFFGTVISSVDGEHLDGALVRIMDGTTEIANTKTGDKGNFKFKVVREGTYTIEISRPGYLTLSVPHIAIVKAEATKKTFSLVPL